MYSVETTGEESGYGAAVIHIQSSMDDGMASVPDILAAMISCISNQRVKKFNLKHKLAETGGSDAHFLAAVYCGLTLFPGRSSKELKRSIRERTTRARNGARVRLKDIGLIQIIRQQRRSRGYFLRGVLKNSVRRFS
jgi:hypothetical protein